MDALFDDAQWDPAGWDGEPDEWLLTAGDSMTGIREDSENPVDVAQAIAMYTPRHDRKVPVSAAALAFTRETVGLAKPRNVAAARVLLSPIAAFTMFWEMQGQPLDAAVLFTVSNIDFYVERTVDQGHAFNRPSLASVLNRVRRVVLNQPKESVRGAQARTRAPPRRAGSPTSTGCSLSPPGCPPS